MAIRNRLSRHLFFIRRIRYLRQKKKTVLLTLCLFRCKGGLSYSEPIRVRYLVQGAMLS